MDVKLGVLSTGISWWMLRIPTVTIAKSGRTITHHPGQITNSCPKYYWESDGKPPVITLAQEAASAAQTLRQIEDYHKVEQTMSAFLITVANTGSLGTKVTVQGDH